MPRIRYLEIARAPLLSPAMRASPENRVFAKLLDFCVCEALAWTLSFFWGPMFFLFPVVFWSLADRWGRGQSPGKWLFGLHVVEMRRGERISAYQGFIRNIPFLLMTIGVGMSGFAWILFFVPAGALILLELYFIFMLRSGLRGGDLVSGTRVADYKDEHTRFIEQFLKEDAV